MVVQKNILVLVTFLLQKRNSMTKIMYRKKKRKKRVYFGSWLQRVRVHGARTWQREVGVAAGARSPEITSHHEHEAESED